MQRSSTNWGSARRERREITRTILDRIDAMVAYWDANRICRFANDAYRTWFGKKGTEIIGLSMEQLLGQVYAKNLPYIARAYGGRQQVFERELTLPDGSVRNSLATYTPDIVAGEVRGLIAHVVDVTPLKELERELEEARAKAEEMATHDFLTGLPNRVTLMDRITSALTRAKRNGEVVAIMTVDMDRFKEINDTYGHGAGDELLVEVSKRMTHAVRETDTVTRYGGDEFLILAPQVESELHAKTMADRLLGHVREPFRLQGSVVEPTFSIGIALYPAHGSAPEELIALSDRALYVAKRLGKNRYAIVEETEQDASDRQIS